MENDGDWAHAIRSQIPEEARVLFGRIPVLTSESKVGYWSLVQSIANAIGPRDVIEWIIVKNMVDLTWEGLFLRRAKVGIIDVARMPALISILGSILPNPSSQELHRLAKGWFTGSSVRSAVADLFIEHKIDFRHIDAEAVRLNAHALEQIERILASLESRYRQAYRDIDFHRESLRIRAQIEGDSAPKRLTFIPPSELSVVKQVPEQEPSNDKGGQKEEDLAAGKPTTE
jgi:hypothetical protein